MRGSCLNVHLEAFGLVVKEVCDRGEDLLAHGVVRRLKVERLRGTLHGGLWGRGALGELWWQRECKRRAEAILNHAQDHGALTTTGLEKRDWGEVGAASEGVDTVSRSAKDDCERVG